MGSQLGAMFSSDIGHWDVHDPAEVVPECYELLTDGVLTPEQFRAFTFTNAVSLYTRADPGFFEGTAIAAGGRSAWAKAWPDDGLRPQPAVGERPVQLELDARSGSGLLEETGIDHVGIWTDKLDGPGWDDAVDKVAAAGSGSAT